MKVGQYIQAIILIPIYFALTPIKIGQKLAGQCPCAKCKEQCAAPHAYSTR